MSNTVTVRGKKTGLAPLGRHFQDNANSSGGSEVGSVLAAKASCTSTCCMGDTETDLQMAYDDKYRKRLYQRRQQRLRNGLLFMFCSLCLLIFTLYRTRGDGGISGRVRLARKGELPHYDGQQHNRHRKRHRDEGHEREKKMHDPTIDDDHKKRHREGGRATDVQNDDKKYFERLNKYDKTRGREDWNKQDGENDDSDEHEEEEDLAMKRNLLELDYLTERMRTNTNTTIRWADMSDVPPLPGREDKSHGNLLFNDKDKKRRNNLKSKQSGKFRVFFQIHRPKSPPMAWEEEFDAIVDKDPTARPDYVNYVHHKYAYPEKLMELPKLGKYPFMRTYKELMDTWPQDNLDNPPDVLQEDLIHFDWNDPADMEAAVKFREAKLPFKVVNVPELLAATEKWTDEYVAQNFDTSTNPNTLQSNGKCSEGPDNFFAFFNRPLWSVPELGLPPTRDNDWTFERWAKHSHYADRVGLHPHKPHFYWQSGVPKEERFEKESMQTFVTKDLPSFSVKKNNFVVFHADKQKGIQCRFGERGITAANHYDGGRNMIAMITGAKRYILSPPRACKRLGIVSNNAHSSFRHSMLNYGHMVGMDARDDIPQEEREWLEMAGSAEAVSTVLKEGEILYVPTGWFHYITSLQKSAQCNVRSGPDHEGDAYWGSGNDISRDCFPHK